MESDDTTPEHKLNVFTFVAQAEILIVWLLFSFLFWLVFMLYQPGFMEIIAGAFFLILLVPILQYGFVIIELTAMGHQRIPRMSANILGADARVYRQLFISAVLIAVVLSVPDNWQWLAIGVSLLIAPAITAFISFHARMTKCLNPFLIWGFITSMGLTYVALRILVTSVLLVLLYFLQRGTEVFDSPGGALLMSSAATYLLITMFRATGALLHTRRNILEIKTDFSQEQVEQQWQKRSVNKRRKVIVEIMKLARAGKMTDVRKRIERELKKDRYEFAETFYEAFREFKDHRPSHVVIERYAPRLMKTDPQRAWQLIETAVNESNGTFQLGTGESVVALYEYAQTPTQKDLAYKLLDQFDAYFPNHPLVRQAHLYAARLGIEFNQVDSALAHFSEVGSRQGQINPALFEECQRLLAKLS